MKPIYLGLAMSLKFKIVSCMGWIVPALGAGPLSYSMRANAKNYSTDAFIKMENLLNNAGSAVSG